MLLAAVIPKSKILLPDFKMLKEDSSLRTKNTAGKVLGSALTAVRV